MMKMDTIEEMVTAVLHDVIEDSKDTDLWTVGRLRVGGFPEDILAALDNLTKREGEPYEAFFERAKKSPLSRKVKFDDLEDNMDVNRIRNITEEDARCLEKYQRVFEELNGLCD
jgi:hypothetical protein